MRVNLLGLTVAGLLAAVLLLVWLLYSEAANNQRLGAQVAALQTKLADHSAAEQLELQGKCAQQAAKVFHAAGYKESDQSGRFDVYASHYNPKLNKCFMTIEVTDMVTVPGKEFITKYLLDAFETREYAEYTWGSSQTKKYWEVAPTICRLIPSSTEEYRCKSDDEYKAFVARYME